MRAECLRRLLCTHNARHINIEIFFSGCHAHVSPRRIQKPTHASVVPAARPAYCFDDRIVVAIPEFFHASFDHRIKPPWSRSTCKPPIPLQSRCFPAPRRSSPSLLSSRLLCPSQPYHKRSRLLSRSGLQSNTSPTHVGCPDVLQYPLSLTSLSCAFSLVAFRCNESSLASKNSFLSIHSSAVSGCTRKGASLSLELEADSRTWNANAPCPSSWAAKTRSSSFRGTLGSCHVRQP